MKILIVTAEPRVPSFAQALAQRYLDGLATRQPITTQWLDLLGSGFEPRLQAADLALYHGTGPVPDDVRVEQQRIEAADLVILAFPVYWWSLPAVLKGWIDRVFTKGWAFESPAAAKPLAGKAVRLIATGGAGPRAYDKHGYRAAITTQIEHGVFHFSGIDDVATHLFLDAERADPAQHERDLAAAFALGASLPPRA
ncbi:NAD(P)H-dependent oxidoreductase [Achromobacter xylosoxidans]|uniref:NAD(P)H-dependent oxidoreductase n=1 Tax=Alcaligenes xylosoxydans xylosoxydans TaxID=85698 RepID=UPI0022B90CE2|nr:NAD(P)H-dependent oxidoreductase [Achromobacter xylosoxidans]MCZ8389221.1 NAD(P)H-dependent oxidoreductase [Achromobacter xylosoxidans]